MQVGAMYSLHRLEANRNAGNARPVGVFALRKTRYAFITTPGAAQIFVPLLVHWHSTPPPGLRHLLRYPRRALNKMDRLKTNLALIKIEHAAGLNQRIR
jgi:hypothetical protein